MSQQLITYIQSLANTSFDAVKEHLIEKGFRVHDEGPLYMICQGTAAATATTATATATAAAAATATATDDYLVHTVGTILTKETNLLVCYGFPKTLDIESEDKLPFSENTVVSEFIDGTLIRAFYDGYSWRLSTNNVINAYNSYWISNKSFGQLFDSCLGDSSNFSTSFLANSLDKDFSYQFIICHPEVHLDSVTEPTMYHVGTYCLKTHCYTSSTLPSNILTPACINIDFTNSGSDTCGKTLQFFSKGCIMYSVGNENSQTPRYKFLNPTYAARRKLLGNTPNMYLRYLECLADGTATEFKTAFPTLTSYSVTVEDCLDRISKDVFDIYVQKFMKKNKETFINFYLRPFVYELHGNFMKSQKKVTRDIIKETFLKYHPKRINFILNGLGMITTGDVVLPKVDVVA